MNNPTSRINSLIIVCLATVVALCPMDAWASKPSKMKASPIVTDRPDVAESSLTVGHTNIQVETGLDVSMGAQGTHLLSLPTKVRFGASSIGEFHLETDILSASVGLRRALEPADFDIGGKLHLLDPHGILPSLGLLIAITLPSNTGVWAISPTIAADWELFNWLGLGINLGTTTTTGLGGNTALRFATSLNWSPAFFPKKLGAYTEIFGAFAFADDVPFELATDFGVTWSISPDTQIDAYARTPLLNDQEAFGFGAGVSFRL